MNSEFKVSAREFRPQKFSEVISQEFATRTLRNAIKNNKIAHAYLFCGPRGTGKTTLARIFAKAMNCTNPLEGEPCNKCESCIEITAGGHPDVFELDAASNRGIDDVRAIQDAAKFYPIKGKFKFFIIDEVHMLTIQAFNALLKILEEPPAYLIFILATTNPEKIPQTITSRCQRFLLSRFKIDEIILKLREVAKERKIKIDEESLFEIARLGDGALRDALGILDMAISFSGTGIKIDELKEFLNLPDKEIYFNITTYIKENNAIEILNLFNDLMNKGFDLQTFYTGLTEHLRNIIIIQNTQNEDLLNETDVIKSNYKKHSEQFSSEEVLRLLNLLFESEQKFKFSFNQKVFMESLLLEMIKLNSEIVNFDKLIEELKEFKKKTLNPELNNIDEIIKKITPQKDPLIEKLKELFDIEEHRN
ncbi:MAG TPA: DNA polymerase III subunit gamma/tau [Ignavibacteria bacterium]|nr:DNA polymerase III subunit gamma/tau [Ignavibacteria bacterium]